jgi:hypothetical protein
MRMLLYKYLCLALLIVLPTTLAAQSNTPNAPRNQPSSPVDATQDLKLEIEQLRSQIEEQKTQIDFIQKVAIDACAKKTDGSYSPVFAAIGVVFAAGLGGFFTLRNQNKQAAQERLLKAVELIMGSKSNYQADIRRQNLSVFLDDRTKQALENIKDKFSGTEFTDLLLSLAQAMSEKATTPSEVLRIWKCVLKEKKVYTSVNYPD